jgi:hypothetical protein
LVREVVGSLVGEAEHRIGLVDAAGGEAAGVPSRRAFRGVTDEADAMIGLRKTRSSLAVAMAAVVVATTCLAANRTKPARAAPRSGLPAAVTTPPAGPVMKVAAVDAGRRGRVRAEAAKIDAHLAARWQEHAVEPSPPLDDAQFVRRIYLELAGRIPTFDETVPFLDSKSASKRADLIDDLLESPDSVSHTYNFWADILRLAERPQKDVFFEPYLDWVKRSIAANRPFDHPQRGGRRA